MCNPDIAFCVKQLILLKSLCLQIQTASLSLVVVPAMSEISVRLCVRARLSEHMRLKFWRDYGVAFDAVLNIVARKRDDGYIHCTYHPMSLMLNLSPTGLNDSIWLLDYPVDSLVGLIDNDTDEFLGDSICVAPKAPLGRAFTKLMRRIRFRKFARATLVRLLSQCSGGVLLPRTVAEQVASYFVTLHPRVA